MNTLFDRISGARILLGTGLVALAILGQPEVVQAQMRAERCLKYGRAVPPKMREAKACFGELVESAESRDESILAAADFFVEHGDTLSAIRLLRIAVEHWNPFRMEWRERLVELYLKRGMDVEAREQFSALILLSASDERVFRLAERRERATGDRSYLLEGLKRLDGGPAGGEESEIAALQYAVALGNRVPVGFPSVGTPALAGRRSVALAEQALRAGDRAKLRAILPRLREYPQYRAQFFRLQGELEHSSGNGAESLKAFVQCLLLDSAEIGCQQGVVANASGRDRMRTEAIDELAHAMVDARNETLGRVWIQSMRRQGDLSELGLRLRSYRELMPNAGWLTQELAHLYIELGGVDEAVALLKSSIGQDPSRRSLLILALARRKQGESEKLHDTLAMMRDRFAHSRPSWSDRDLLETLAREQALLSKRKSQTSQRGLPASALVDARSQPLGETRGQLYSVKAGDTLSAISEHIYGRVRYRDEILFADGSRITKPESLRVGDQLYLPRLPGVNFQSEREPSSVPDRNN